MRTRPETSIEKKANRSLKISEQLLRCGTVPSYTQAEIDVLVPTCPSIVFNSDTLVLNFWNGTEWSEVSGGGFDYLMVGQDDLVTGGTEELLIDRDLVKIDPESNNMAWTVTMDWAAAVTSITGTATGISVGDTIGGKLIFTYKKVGGVASSNGTIYDTINGHASLVSNGSRIDYQIGASDE
jgi:hypothetical protein